MSSLTFDPTYAPHSGRHRRPSVISRPGPAPRPVVADVAMVLAGLGFGACVALAVTAESWKQFSAPGGVAMFLGNLTGLAGTYLALVMVLLVSRIPVVERVLGQDKLLASHRRLAPWPISLIVAHAVLLTFAYAEAARTGVFGQIGAFIRSYPDMLTATIALVVMVAVAITSVYSIRRRLRREMWWAVHLFMYLALALAFAHEIALGPSFVGHPLTQDRLVPALGLERGPRARLPIRAPVVQDVPAPPRGRGGPFGRTGYGLGHLPGQEPRPPRGGGRSVLRVALPHKGDVVAGSPVLPLGTAPAAFLADHGEGHR